MLGPIRLCYSLIRLRNPALSSSQTLPGEQYCKGKPSSDANKMLQRRPEKCELQRLMLVVKGCCSNEDVCGKLALLSNWDVSCITRRAVVFTQLPLAVKNHPYAATALVHDKFL